MDRNLLGVGLGIGLGIGFVTYRAIRKYYIFRSKGFGTSARARFANGDFTKTEQIEGNSKIVQEQCDELFSQYQLAFDSAREGICLVDSNAKLLLSNAAFQRMTGYGKEELSGRFLHHVLHRQHIEGNECNKGNKNNGSNNACELSLFLDAIRSGTTCHKQHEVFWRKDGTRLLVEYNLDPIVEQGIPKGAVVCLLDVTSRKKAEEMILESAKLSVVGQLAASVVHEIRNPLTSLIGFVKLLADDSEVAAANVDTKSGFGGPEYRTKDKARKYFEIMKSELERIENIVDEFLILAKPSRVQFKPVDLSGCINRVFDLFRNQAANRQIEFELAVDESVPVIECDESQLKQVFVNLVKNAMEAMPSGGKVRISASAMADSRMDDKKKELLIAVTDTGQGIPEEMIPKLGEPFYSTKKSGTGLGLMISQKIIESHHGSIKIRSKLGKGTVVELRIPRYQ